MADQKITDLAAIAGANIATADLFVLVDVSDTSMAATGTDKKTTTTDVATTVAANLPAGSVANAALTTNPLARANHTGTQAANTITGLATIATSGSASDLGSGTVATARLGTGTANGATFLRGDGTWAAWQTPTAKTADYTAATGDIVLANTTSALFTVTLPAATAGAVVVVKKTDASTNAVAITGASGALIDGAAFAYTATQYESLTVIADGTNWWRI